MRKKDKEIKITDEDVIYNQARVTYNSEMVYAIGGLLRSTGKGFTIRYMVDLLGYNICDISELVNNYMPNVKDWDIKTFELKDGTKVYYMPSAPKFQERIESIKYYDDILNDIEFVREARNHNLKQQRYDNR